MASDDDRRRKSRKHDSRSSREGDRRRKDDERREDRHRDHSRDSKSGRGKEDGKDAGRSRGGSKLTEEEERLYAKAKAQEYLEREGKGDDRRRKHDKHAKDSKRRRSGSESHGDSSDSDRKRHRDRKDHKRSKKDDDHDKSSRHKKKSKHGHREEKQKHINKTHSSKADGSSKGKASPPDPSNLVSLGEITTEAPSSKLDPEENYFSHNSHLRLYLYRKFGIYFEDLTSSGSHSHFHDFTKSYNSGKLEKAYYNPSGLLPQDALDQCQRTKHKWKFNTNRLEEQSLEFVRAGVKKQTEYNDSKGETVSSAAATKIGPSRQLQIAPRKDDTNDGANRRKTPAEISAQRQSDKHHRDRIKLANEEMYGVTKADAGWERQRENRREQSEKLHGAAKDRESEAWGGAELNDDAIYGTAGVGGGGRGRRGESSYEEAVAKKRQYRERKENEKAARTSELLKKEEEKQKKMFEMLGLTAGKKIQIAPRNDT